VPQDATRDNLNVLLDVLLLTVLLRADTSLANTPDISCANDNARAAAVVSKLKCPVLLASEMSGFGFISFIQ
jgi:hypothetical protein